jgi:hypothetical protein
MLRSTAILSVTIFFACPAMAFPPGVKPVGSIDDGVLEVRLTKSNACKYKYKFKKAAQHLRKEAHCK